MRMTFRLLYRWNRGLIEFDFSLVVNEIVNVDSNEASIVSFGVRLPLRQAHVMDVE